MTRRVGTTFEDAEVVELYLHRQPYPQALYRELARLAPAHDALLDLGCGNGKISRPLANHFKHVTAIDPSVRMIELGQSLTGGGAANIEWIEGLAEDASFRSGTYDLVVAAQSIHWMDQERLLPRLRRCVRPEHILAVVSGDHAFDPPWEDDWQKFLEKWVPKITGITLRETKRRRSSRNRYQRFVDVAGEQDLVSDPVSQSVDDFVNCQHSRDTFAFSKLGEQTEAFDSELREIVSPHAANDTLTFRVRTNLTWGQIAG